MTSLFTPQYTPTIEEIDLEPSPLQQRVLQSFCATVLIGILLCTAYLARRVGVSVEGSESWVVAALPDPPAALPDSASPYLQSSALKLDMVATEDSWVFVETDGHASYANLIRAEQTLSFEASTKIRMRTGNAPGLELRFNGERVTSNDRRVRSLEFTSEGARDLDSASRVTKS